MTRDFSDESKQKMLNLVTQVEHEKLCNFTDWIGDRWYDFQDWIGVLDIKHYIDDVNSYHKKIIDKNNATEQAIMNIFDAVGVVDREYAGKLGTTRSVLENWKRYITQLTEIVSPLHGRFTTEYMGQVLSKLLDESILSTSKVEETAIEIESQEDLLNRILELTEKLLAIEDEGELKDVSGFVGSLLSCIRKWIELMDGDAENGWIIAQETFELAEKNVDLWGELAKLLKYFYELKEIPGVETAGLLEELSALIASILEAAGKDYDSVGEQIGEAIKKIGGSLTDLAAAIYKILEKTAEASVRIYAGIVKAIIASYGQFIESLEEYAKDGDYDLGDIAETGVDVAIEGLATLISTVSYGIISEKTTGMTAEEVREKLKESADQLGKDAAEYIINNPKLREMYNNGNGAERAVLIAYAVAMVQESKYQHPGRQYYGNPDEIAAQIAIDKSQRAPYYWGP